MSGAFRVMIHMWSYGPDDQLCFGSTMSHMWMRMGRGMMSRLVMAWRVLEYNCDDSYPVKLSPANVCHAVNFITSGKAETVVQVSKWGWKGPHPPYHPSWMHTQTHPKACSPIPSQIHLQTSLYPQPVYHLVPLLPFSKPISCHLTQGDWF